MNKHTEARLEDAIIDHLTTQGGYVFVDYREGEAKDRYDKARALDPALVLGFIQATQEKMWQSLEGIHKAETGKVVLDHLVKELETKGMLKVLRQGFKCYGKKLRVAVFAPNNRMNPDTLALYSKNVLSVTRQLYYGTEHSKSLDLVIFLNGLPIVTAELKNPLSGQKVEAAKRQYKKDRDHRELLFDFTKRTLVHFAVDQDQVLMTTRLSGDKTHFLPFNLGNQGHAGNPPAADGGYRTAYLWREVWQRDSLLDILGRFMHLQVEEKRILTDEGSRKITKETMIFPPVSPTRLCARPGPSRQGQWPREKPPRPELGGFRQVQLHRLAGASPLQPARRRRPARRGRAGDDAPGQTAEPELFRLHRHPQIQDEEDLR